MEQIIPPNYLKKNQMKFAKWLDESWNNKNVTQKVPKIAVNIQYASFGIPGGQGIFRSIQQAMAVIPPLIILKPYIKTFLSDWCSIVT